MTKAMPKNRTTRFAPSATSPNDFCKSDNMIGIVFTHGIVLEFLSYLFLELMCKVNIVKLFTRDRINLKKLGR